MYYCGEYSSSEWYGEGAWPVCCFISCWLCCVSGEKQSHMLKRRPGGIIPSTLLVLPLFPRLCYPDSVSFFISLYPDLREVADFA